MKFTVTTIKDIATALGMSTSTVSRALSDSYQISQATKDKVLAYAKKINYKPNPIALSLKAKKSRSIGIVVSEFANNFFSQIISGIESVANERNYQVIFTQTRESKEKEIAAIEYLASRSVDGLIVSLSSETSETGLLKDYNERGLAVVLLDRITSEINTHKVILSNHTAAFEATEHLMQKGYKRIAHFSSSPHLSNTQERLQGYKDALKKYNIPFDEQLIQYCLHGGRDLAEMQQAINKLLKAKKKPDAILTCADRITTGCLSILQQLKVEIPKDMAIMGFTNTNLAPLFNPALTAVVQPAFEMGEKAATMLIELIESKRPVTSFTTHTFNAKIIQGKSC